MTFELLVVLLLVALNGFLAMSELAVVSSRRSRLQAMADDGRRGARQALALAEQPGHFLSSVQIGITLIGLVAGVFSGTAIAGPFAAWLETRGVADRVSELIAFPTVVGAVTYLSLVVGELVPKRIALQRPEAMAARVAPAMALFTRAAWPLVVLLEASSRLLLRPLGGAARAEASITGEEIKALIAEAESAGVIPSQARSMIGGVMRLGERGVRGVMTLRQDVDWIDLSGSDAEIHARLKASRHSRLPAGHGSLDAISGIIRVKDLLDAHLEGRVADPRSLVREAPTVIDSVSALRAMEVLRGSDTHIVLVVDEYGSFQGVVTTTDILESIAGAFPASLEETAPGAVQRKDGSWLVDGALPVDEMADRIGLMLAPSADYQTVAGFMLARMMRIPAAGDSFTYRGWRFEVVDMDGRRIDKVLAMRVSERRQYGPA